MADIGKEGGTGYPGANVYTAAKAGYLPDDVDLRKIIYRGAQGKLDSTNWGGADQHLLRLRQGSGGIQRQLPQRGLPPDQRAE